jgi:SAM-dependent methyltransferase
VLGHTPCVCPACVHNSWVADAHFEVPRLAALYDPLDPDRRDLDTYVALVDEYRVRSVLDVGCGTGSFACLLAERGLEVTGLDPAVASLEVARRKPYASLVRWIVGEATSIPPTKVDLATMTGNVAQVFLEDAAWKSALRAIGGAVRIGGVLAFEVRDPAREAWREWTRDRSFRRVELPGVGLLETWVQVTDVRLPLVSFTTSFLFPEEGTLLTSESTLRFRNQAEVIGSLTASGFAVDSVRDAADRPGLEWVFVAHRVEVP